jgi:hypothetical protein
MGCALPTDEALAAKGWEFRCNTDANRLCEVVDAFEEMGFEVRLEKLNLEGIDESCSGCMETLCELSAVYVRRPEKGSATG